MSRRHCGTSVAVPGLFRRSREVEPSSAWFHRPILRCRIRPRRTRCRTRLLRKPSPVRRSGRAVARRPSSAPLAPLLPPARVVFRATCQTAPARGAAGSFPIQRLPAPPARRQPDRDPRAASGRPSSPRRPRRPTRPAWLSAPQVRASRTRGEWKYDWVWSARWRTWEVSGSGAAGEFDTSGRMSS